jgi:hypothetical protein
MNRIYTRKSLLRRISSNRWLVAALIVAAFLALPAIAEAACNAIGVGYDPRIGAP